MVSCKECGHIRYDNDPFNGECADCEDWAIRHIIELREKLEAVREFIESRKTYFPENSLGCVEIHIADGGVDKLDALLKP